jgi:glycosyltransferase involved in cell wall biosynthesis
MLSPLLFGSGIKIKTIEALRCGIPLISTEPGVEGVAFEGISGIKMVNDLESFPQAMVDFLDPVLNAAGAKANLAAFRANYSRGVVDSSYQRAFLTRKRQN